MRINPAFVKHCYDSVDFAPERHNGKACALAAVMVANPDLVESLPVEYVTGFIDGFDGWKPREADPEYREGHFDGMLCAGAVFEPVLARSHSASYWPSTSSARLSPTGCSLGRPRRT